MVPVALTQPAQQDLTAFLRREADRLGLDALGICGLEDFHQTGAFLRDFVARGRHGDMSWMAETLDRRADPIRLWPEARSAIVVGHSYAPETDPLAVLLEKERGAISVYAKGRDYHDVLKARIKQLARAFAKESAGDVKVFVDTAPLMEKPLAERAGLGWQGKHTNLVSRDHGSWLFLGIILTTVPLMPTPAVGDHCGSCRKCLDVCPTDAFPAPYQLDARRCIAYLTIEHKGHIPREMRSAIGNRVFGCDDCLAVCPWNKFAEASREQKYQAQSHRDGPPIDTLLDLDDAAFRAMFAGTPVKRTGRDRVVRNSLIAAGNSGSHAFVERVKALLNDDSSLVRAAAVWAYRKLETGEVAGDVRRLHLARETDDAVRDEWSGNPDGTPNVERKAL